MSLGLSTGLRNFLLEGGALKQAFANSRIQVYTGSKPASPDAAIAGTLLATITLNAGVFTPEVQAVGSVALTGGGAGSVNTITVDAISILPAAVPFNGTLAQTALDVISAINDNSKNTKFVASFTLPATITLTAKPGLGTQGNGVVVSTVTTITKTDTDLTGGTDAANGLTFDDASGGVISKPATTVWSGIAAQTGTAGWFRMLGSVADAGVADSAETFIRLDGTVATSGADLNMSNTNFVAGATQTLSTFSFTMPAA
jgi:hypothetical protein